MTKRQSRRQLGPSRRRERKRFVSNERAMDRKPFLEMLEDRRLMAVGPRLTGIQPNNSDLFSFDNQSSNVRSVAPGR